MASNLATTGLNKFLTLLPETHIHSHSNQVNESAIVDSRSGSHTDLSLAAAAADDAAKVSRSGSTASTASTVSAKSAGGFSFLKLGN